MTTHARHKHIVPVQILKADGASEHAVLALLGAAGTALGRAALRYKHAGPVEFWGGTRVADIEHLRDTCTTENCVLQQYIHNVHKGKLCIDIMQGFTVSLV